MAVLRMKGKWCPWIRDDRPFTPAFFPLSLWRGWLDIPLILCYIIRSVLNRNSTCQIPAERSRRVRGFGVSDMEPAWEQQKAKRNRYMAGYS